MSADYARNDSQCAYNHDERMVMFPINEQITEEFRDRLIYLCLSLAPEKGAYEYLEQRTGISAAKWKNLILRRQMPTLEMIMSMCFYRRGYEKWLLWGHTNEGFPDFSPKKEEWEAYEGLLKWKRKQAEKTTKNVH